MSLYLAGGYGEHGRNCFLIENCNFNIMIDCGILKGDDDPYPRLSKEQIRFTKYLFLTHSHTDHTGALEYFYQQGFSGIVILSEKTYQQMKFKPVCYLFVETVSDFMKEYTLEDELSFLFGRSGHCIGSLWYKIEAFGETYLFSGDYCENSLFYQCDNIRDQYADEAVLDCAYGKNEKDAGKNIVSFGIKLKLFCEEKSQILLPVPEYGRGSEILKYIKTIGIIDRVYADENVRRPFIEYSDHKPWLRGFSCCSENSDMDSAKIILISDPQLKHPSNQKLAEKIMDHGGVVLFSGNVDKGSYGEYLINEKKAYYSVYPVHQNLNEMKQLVEKNDFINIYPVHSAEMSIKDVVYK